MAAQQDGPFSARTRSWDIPSNGDLGKVDAFGKSGDGLFPAFAGAGTSGGSGTLDRKGLGHGYGVDPGVELGLCRYAAF